MTSHSHQNSLKTRRNINNATVITNILFESILFTHREKEAISLAFRVSKIIGMGWKSPENRDIFFLIMKERVEIKQESKILTVLQKILISVFIYALSTTHC